MGEKISDEKILITPNEKRDYKKVVDSILKEIKVIEIESEYDKILSENIDATKDKGIILIIEVILKLLKNQYAKMGAIIDKEIADISKVLKVIILDIEDYKKAYKTFKGIQIFSVQRSICDHLLMYMLLLLSKDSREVFFEGYTNEEEKIKRFNDFFKRKNIIKKIKEKIKEIKEKDKLYEKSLLLKNIESVILSPNLKKLYSKYSELNHLNEIVLVEKYYKDKIEMEEVSDKIMDKQIDEYLFFLVWRILMIYELNQNIQSNYLGNEYYEIEDEKLYIFLSIILEKMEKYRKLDLLSVHIANKARDIIGIEEKIEYL